MSATLNHVELPNGVKIPYAEQGDRRGTPVVFLHGFPDSLHAFDTLLPYLPSSIRAIVPTQRGFGDASRPETGYSMDDFAADANAFLDALNIQSVIAVGHSMGSLVAQRMAVLYPDRVRGLVLIGSASTFRSNAGVEWLIESVASMSDPIAPEFVHEFQGGMFTQPAPPDYFATLIAENLKAPHRVWKAALNGIEAFDNRDDLSRITVPTVIVWGDQDELCSRSEQELLLAGIPDSRLVVYQGLGHAPNWDEPQAIVGNLLELITRLKG